VTARSHNDAVEALPVPRGWFALGFSPEIRSGRLERRVLGGREIVVFRTDGGALGALDAYCPHLGAHLGYGGRVVGECVRCPFHGFTFDATGACVTTPYAGRPPKARATSIPVRERHGVVLAWHGPDDAPPSFEVPELDMTGFSPLRWHRFTLRGHPQETSENSVDTGHLSMVHGYAHVDTLRPARAGGPRLDARYTMTRRIGSASYGPPLRSEFEVQLHGLGYSFVEVTTSVGVVTRQFVLSTPTEPGRIDLRIACAVKAPLVAPRLGALDPGRAIAAALNRGLIGAYVRDVGQDLDIWRHKRYLHPPALAEGDGPVGLYRRWAAQFYQPAGSA
jgi:nitrite reductase/ring-hydroxylating ferredoxin subunit